MEENQIIEVETTLEEKEQGETETKEEDLSVIKKETLEEKSNEEEVNFQTEGVRDENESQPTQAKDMDVSEDDESSDQWFKEDREDFYGKYPDNNIDELLTDKRFLKYAEKRIGKDKMSEIYEDYTSLVNDLEAKIKSDFENAVKIKEAKAKASPGSLTEVSATSTPEYYTLDEIKKMSAEYIDEHWEKVQRSIQRAKK